jgi:hypothetical protein
VSDSGVAVIAAYEGLVVDLSAPQPLRALPRSVP